VSMGEVWRLVRRGSLCLVLESGIGKLDGVALFLGPQRVVLVGKL
jgi:hypothetical protein